MLAQVTLAEDRIAGDHATTQGNRLEQCQGRFVFIGVGRHGQLPQHTARSLIVQCEQMDTALMGVERATESFAIKCDRMRRIAWTGWRHERFDPSLNRFFKRLRFDAFEQIAIHVGTRWSAAKAEGVPDGWFLVANPLGDGFAPTRTGRESTNNRGQRGR